MKLNLDLIEAHLRALFEDGLYKLTNSEGSQFNIIEQLSQVIQANLIENHKGTVYAPDRYTFLIPEGQISAWENQQDILGQITAKLQSLGRMDDFQFLTEPQIQLQGVPNSQQTAITIQASFSSEVTNLPDTAAMEQPFLAASTTPLPGNAFLVIGGRSNFPLLTPIINIGRHSDNDLVLDDLYVSRHHAQIRAINKHYVVFDVGSTGGILLNGKKVSQATLRPGDVLKIGMVNLIYIQDVTSEQATTAVLIEPEDPPFGDNHE
ncbi:DUF3662 domain-containing protein [Chloroflexota bacterium]|nr:DUF3662 domain-containing protein [Chloroflexota bacterium]